MSQENVEIVRRFVDSYNRRDRKAVSEVIHPEVEWHTLAGPVFGVEAIHGRDDVLGFLFERIPDALNDFRVEAAELDELTENRVLALGRYVARGLASEADVEMSITAIYRVEAGMIMFFQDFTAHTEALEAAGLQE